MSFQHRLVLSIIVVLFVAAVVLLIVDLPAAVHSAKTVGGRTLHSGPGKSAALVKRGKTTHTVDSRLQQYGKQARSRLQPHFNRAGVTYPPERIALLGFKREKRIELWAQQNGDWFAIKQYPLTAYSGVLGPKLVEGDRQIPEGLYKVIGLNPNSSYHLSMKINYPNKFDLHYANREKRLSPGSNIFIHGSNKSIGCLAVGNSGIEELFVLVWDTGMDKAEVIVAPYDMRNKTARRHKKIAIGNRTDWLNVLYDNLRESLSRFSNSHNNRLTEM